MPTIRQMYGGMYNFFKTNYASGQLFRQTTQKNNFSSLTSNYSELAQTYNQTKNTFDSKFDETMTNLKKSATEVKNFDFNSSESSDAMKKVENFLNDYNDAINFFNDNSSISKRVSNLAKNFSDTTYFAKNYSEIGIVVSEDGTAKIDEEKFLNSAQKNPQKVSRILKNFSDRADKKILNANLQKNNLFPKMQNMLGNNFNNFSAYGSGGLLRTNSYSSVGSLLNMFF